MLNSAQESLEFEDLTAIYRVERKAPSLSAVRRDLYPAMAGLLKSLNAEYSKQLSHDPDSLVCEGANQRRKKAKQLSKEIVELRMQKICAMALRGAMGAQNVIDQLTSEEKEYYSNILDASKKHDCILSRLAGEKRYDSPKIDTESKIKDEPIQTAYEPKPIPEPTPVEDVPAELEEIQTEAEIPNDLDPEMDDSMFDEFPPEEEISENKMAEEDEVFVQKPTSPIPISESAIEEEHEETEYVVLRILEDLPAFSGPDRDYSLSKEDVVKMPKIMADALINRNKAIKLIPTE